MVVIGSHNLFSDITYYKLISNYDWFLNQYAIDSVIIITDYKLLSNYKSVQVLWLILTNNSAILYLPITNYFVIMIAV